MSEMILIIGESGTGKSSSIRNIEASDTMLIQVVSKPLPFRGWKSKYTTMNKEGGNLICTDNSDKICKALRHASDTGVKLVVIDDFQYLMANEYMRRAKETGFQKFTDIGLNAYAPLSIAPHLRDDMTIVFLSHSEKSEDGTTKMKTIGKMLDEKINLAGLFTIVLHTIVSDGKYGFLTNTDGRHLAKSPAGMFEDQIIDNDLKLVIDKVSEYNNG